MNDQQHTNGAVGREEIEQQVVKGVGLLLLCLERGRGLSMKGFIDSQLERGEVFYPVVEQVVHHIDSRLAGAATKEQRALLLDLHSYADAQLRAAVALNGQSPGEG